MKDSSVSPAGLFDTRRQHTLLQGLADRFRSCLDQHQQLHTQHLAQHDHQESELAALRAQATGECRNERRQMLMHWDQADEQLTGSYERAAVQTRMELNRVAALYRRKAADEKKAIERKVTARQQAISHQYENRKNQPGQQMRKEIKLIDSSLTVIHEQLEWARALTIRRLDRLPEVPPAQGPDDDVRQPPPQSVQETLEINDQLRRQCGKVVAEMQTGTASKIVDSFYLPGGVAAFVAIWAIVAFFVAPRPPWLWMAAGIVPAGMLGFAIYLILLWPLKRMTRTLYPRVERIAQAAEDCAAAGRKIATKIATDASAELLHRRDKHLQTAKKWEMEQLSEMEQRLQEEQTELRQKLLATLQASDADYTRRLAQLSNEMRGRAETVADKITQRLAATDQTVQQRRHQVRQSQQEQLEHLVGRLRAGVQRGLRRIAVTSERVEEWFPPWRDVHAVNASGKPEVDFLPLGSLAIDDQLRRALSADAVQQSAAQGIESQGNLTQEIGAQGNGAPRTWNQLLNDVPLPSSLPVALHRRLYSALVIQSPAAQLPKAIDLAHQVLWRLLCAAPPGRAKLTLIDPLGRGQHFTSFMALADHDPAIVGHRVWTTDNKIDARLSELAHHVEDVLQASLRDRFERIEDYNQVAGSMAEPYRAVAAVGFPEGLTRDSYRHLRALIESGLRCGIFTVLVCDQDKPWPSDMPAPAGDKVLQLHVDAAGQWRLQSPGLQQLPFRPASPPPVARREQLVDMIGTAAVAAARVEIPLRQVLSAGKQAAGSTSDGIDIPIGSQGANRSLKLALGEGVRQHVLIAGKTGSGKSTLLHSIITSGAYHFRPDQLQFYLLDFKKGVEFKPYADTELPHARVIGIESEREFGRSVLARLDQELQHRGESFRAVGVQELAEYRQASSQPMPRIMLVVDEFQELFVRDDRLASDCAMLLDRLVRQGRSFGMHVVLSSQSLAGAYSLPRATLGQMAVRIAMQCSESDASLILSEDNTAARLINRPGEAIYNDAGGLVEGNQPFQVAWLSSSDHRQMLAEITRRDQSVASQYPPPVVFEGNRPCRWTPALADAATEGSSAAATLQGLLGESVEIGPPLALPLTRNSGRNVVLISSSESRRAVIATSVAGMAKADGRLCVKYFDAARVDDPDSLAPWFVAAGITIETIKPRDAETQLTQLLELVHGRGDEADDTPPIIAIIDPLERFRDLRQDESFSFSLDAPGGGGGGKVLQDLLRDGPSANVFVMLVCSSAETLSRWLPRTSQHDLELRILGQMNQSDSSVLIDSPLAADLSAATMLLYDDSDGRITKFRQCDLPDAALVQTWLAR